MSICILIVYILRVLFSSKREGKVNKTYIHPQGANVRLIREDNVYIRLRSVDCCKKNTNSSESSREKIIPSVGN